MLPQNSPLSPTHRLTLFSSRYLNVQAVVGKFDFTLLEILQWQLCFSYSLQEFWLYLVCFTKPTPNDKLTVKHAHWQWKWHLSEISTGPESSVPVSAQAIWSWVHRSLLFLYMSFIFGCVVSLCSNAQHTEFCYYMLNSLRGTFA